MDRFNIRISEEDEQIDDDSPLSEELPKVQDTSRVGTMIEL